MNVPTHRDGPMAFVDDPTAPDLDRDDRHHLARVLRTRDGAPMVVCDGRGTWMRATFGDPVVVEGKSHSVPTPSPVVTVAFALIKGDRPELVVQKLTELGVDRIVPFVADHGVVQWNAERADKQVVRLRRIAREASMQCRRTHLPVVEPVTTFDALCSAPAPPVLADADGDPFPVVWADVTQSLGSDGVAPTILIGPEGGWSDAERSAGLRAVRIGDHVLRAETASITAAVLATSWRSNRAAVRTDYDNGG